MTLARCPGCQARLTEDPACPRCGCDLTLVRRAEVQARQLVVRAVHAWVQGDHERARVLARSALVIDNSPLGLAVLQGSGSTSRSGLQ